MGHVIIERNKKDDENDKNGRMGLEWYVVKRC